MSLNLNLPIALHWWWSVGAVKVWHFLVIMKGKDPPNNIVALCHKAWLEAILNHAHFGWSGEAGHLGISRREDTDKIKQVN